MDSEIRFASRGRVVRVTMKAEIIPNTEKCMMPLRGARPMKWGTEKGSRLPLIHEKPRHENSDEQTW